MRATAVALFAFLPGVAAADPVPKFVQPIECTLGRDCYIQNYVDTDPGPDYRDFRCQKLAYNGHKGTDFGLFNHAHMHKGVPVLAAATGVVKAFRDGMPDTGLTDATRATIKGRECGNGVVIDHGHGWVSQYCHLRRGSVRVRRGQRVAAGTPIGLVGLSGRTEFPHVHMSIRYNGETIDPYSPDQRNQCSNDQPTRTLWQTTPLYAPGGILTLGFSPRIPQFSEIKRGDVPAATANARHLVLWMHAFGGRPGDQISLEITAPDGREILRKTVQMRRHSALFFRAAGRGNKRQPWPAGIYHGRAALIRDGRVVSERDLHHEIRKP